MNRELAWYPGVHSNLNHLYDLQTGAALCGSAARKQGGWHQTWRDVDCPKCIIMADKIHNDERDAQGVGCCDECDENDGMNGY